MAAGKTEQQNTKKPLVTNKSGSRHGKPSSISSFVGTSKLVRRLNRASKKQQVNIGDNVSFVYNGKKQLGIVRYTGSTNFSAGKWCGIELTEKVGKHNGTVKGHQYFICNESYGIFVPLQKISVVPPRKHTHHPDETDDMRITVRSIKTAPPLPPRDDNSLGNTTTDELSRPVLSHSSDSGIESPSHVTKEERPKHPTPTSDHKKKGSKKGSFVISSFVTPTPKRAVMLTPKDENEVEEKDIFVNHDDFSKLRFLKNDVVNGGMELDTSDIISSEKRHDSTCKYKTEDEEITKKDEGEDMNVRDDDVFLYKQHGDDNTPKLPPDDGISKIPRPVVTSTSFKLRKTEKIDITLIPPRRKTSLKERVEMSIPPKLPSKKNSTSDNTANHGKKEISYIQKKTTSPWTKRRKSSKGKQNVDKKEIGLKRGGSHDEPSFVMGNNNASNRGSLRKQNTIGCEVDLHQHNVNEVFSQREIQGAIVIDRKGKENRVKTKVNTKSNAFVADSKDRSPTELQKEIKDLHNQLNERTDRITELEVALKNNNVKEKEKSEFENTKAIIQNELKIKNKSIIELKEKLSFADSLIKTSNNGLEALTVVIQYYLTQVEQATERYSTANKDSLNLTRQHDDFIAKQQEAIMQIDDMSTRLDAAQNLSDESEKELRKLKADHEQQITDLENKHTQEKAQISATLEEQKNTQRLKLLDQHKEELDKQKTIQEYELSQLKSQHDDKLQEVNKEKENDINEIHKQHEQRLQQKETEHAKKLSKLEEEHAKQCKSLQENINTLEDGKTVLSDRLKEVMNELESDTNVQAALAQYKHLPAELESLQAVLDMKNDELKNTRIKCMELEKKVEEFYELQTKCEVLTQENQSLAEVLRKRVKAERQISVERDSLLEKFEQESRKVSRLSMEKEQLIWRASNPDLSFNSNSSNVFDEEEEACPPSPLQCSSCSFSSSPPKQMSKKMKRRSMNFPLSQSDYILK